MADDVKIRIGADDKASAKIKGINRSTTDMSKALRNAGIAMVAMGAAIGFALIKMTNNYAKAGDEVAKMAKRTGWGTVALSEMRHATELSGASLNDIEKASKKMSKTISDARDGLETYVRAFTKLGINVDELAAKKPEEQFWTIASALADLEDHTLKVALAQDMFGRAGTKLIPMLDSGSTAIADMRQEAHDLNLVFSEESARAAEDFEDAKTRMTGALTGLANTIASAVMPEFEKLVKVITEKLNVAMSWLSEHPEVASAFLKLALILGAGGVAFIAISQFVKMLAALRAALIMIHALSGPKGWAILAVGAAVAAGAVVGFQELTKSAEEAAVPSMQRGGVVPGPVGQPRLIVAHGQERFLGPRGQRGGELHVHIHTEVFEGREEDARAFARKMHRILREENRVGTVGVTM